MEDPNFFILGAPKCGTTSMAAWLRAHENVHVPDLKEPEYFNTDHKRRRVLSQKNYESLFKPAKPLKHKAVGEASVWYLYSDVAVEKILHTYGDSTKFIVMLRNPLDMAMSLHWQQLYVNFEHIRDFEQAWRAQDARRRGTGVFTDAEARQLLYGDACKLGFQLDRLRSKVDPARIKPVLLSDMHSDPGMAYRDVLGFLGLPDDGRTEFPHLNKSRTYTNAWLHNAIQCAARLKLKLGIRYNFHLQDKCAKPAAKPRLRPAFRDELNRYFRDDVALLSGLLNRDLTHWVT
jgi:hypothetical protein